MSEAKLLPLDEAASQLNVSKSTLHRILKRGDMKFVAITPKKRMIPTEELNRFVRNLQGAA